MTEHQGQSWQKRAHELADEHRPARYDSGDRWRSQLATDWAAIVPVAEAQEELLRRELDRHETERKRSSAALFRRIAKDRQMPLDWLEVRRDPILLDESDGTTAQLCQLTWEDLDQLWRRAEARKRKDDRNYLDLVDGIDLVKGWLREHDAHTMDELASDRDDPPGALV